MKLIINIPEEDYNHAKQQVADGIMNPLKIFITSGTPIPDNATNGDVMYKMFGICLDDFKKTWGSGEFTDAWWNAPYQKGGKE